MNLNELTVDGVALQIGDKAKFSNEAMQIAASIICDVESVYTDMLIVKAIQSRGSYGILFCLEGQTGKQVLAFSSQLESYNET